MDVFLRAKRKADNIVSKRVRGKVYIILIDKVIDIVLNGVVRNFSKVDRGNVTGVEGVPNFGKVDIKDVPNIRIGDLIETLMSVFREVIVFLISQMG